MPMNPGGNSFRERVENLRRSWEERREVARMAPVGDRESRFQVLLSVYEWAVQAVEAVRSVYGDTLPVAVTPSPRANDMQPSFSVLIDEAQALSFGLNQLTPADGTRWTVTAWMRSGETVVEEYLGRRPVRWTRRRVEDLLLNLLAEYERATRLDAAG